MDHVVPVGGPMDGQWFTTDDWAERRAASQRMVDRGQPPSSCLSYVETREDVDNRRMRDSAGVALRGRIWRFNAPAPAPS
jgi:hypothetical protein